MNNYKIYANSEDHIEAVKQGWSWPAFFFPGIWAVGKRLWVVTALSVIAAIAIEITFGVVALTYPGNTSITSWGYLGSVTIGCTILGALGNSLRERNLVARGFELIDTLRAADDIDAEIAHRRERKLANEKGWVVSSTTKCNT